MIDHRKELVRREVNQDHRFLTFSCYQRLPLFSNDRVKDLFVARLEAVRCEVPLELTAWVIMPEHVHLMMRPSLPDYPVARVLHALKRPFAERVIGRWRELEAPVLARITTRQGAARFWQPGGGYDRNIYGAEEMREKFNYIHQNPVKRGLVETATEWKWSSARWYAGMRDGTPAMDEERF